MGLNFGFLSTVLVLCVVFVLTILPAPSYSARIAGGRGGGRGGGRVGGGGGGGRQYQTPYGRFKHRHVIKESRHPGHQQWTAAEWNQYATRKGLDGPDRNRNSFISVGSQSEIKNSFREPGVGSRISHGRHAGELQYRSKDYHNVYQLTRPQGRRNGPYNVEVYRGATYKAALDNQNRPVHFDAASITDSLGLSSRPINRK